MNAELKLRLDALTVFRPLLEDKAVGALRRFMENGRVDEYAEFVAALYETSAGDLSKHIMTLCESSENVYVKAVGMGKQSPECIKNSVKAELQTLQMLADLKSKELLADHEQADFLPKFESGGLDIAAGFEHRVRNIGKFGYGMYAGNHMFYIDESDRIVPVRNPDSITLDKLVDYETQRQKVIDNTKALLAGKPAANMLLTGDAGTGKSSTIKAVANAMHSEGLRIIEVRKEQLRSIPRILDELAMNPLKFILFIDDLSFLKDDDNFNALKAVLEGSVSAKSKNVVIYATSNRRHIIRERFSDREGDDIHRNETMQEFVSLSERFGIHITFQKPNKATFLHIVASLAKEEGIDMEASELELLAERFALERGGRSARLARQFIDGLLAAR